MIVIMVLIPTNMSMRLYVSILICMTVKDGFFLLWMIGRLLLHWVLRFRFRVFWLFLRRWIPGFLFHWVFRLNRVLGLVLTRVKWITRMMIVEVRTTYMLMRNNVTVCISVSM